MNQLLSLTALSEDSGIEMQMHQIDKKFLVRFQYINAAAANADIIYLDIAPAEIKAIASRLMHAHNQAADATKVFSDNELNYEQPYRRRWLKWLK